MSRFAFLYADDLITMAASEESLRDKIVSVVTIASEPASIDYDRSFEKKSRCRFDVTRACGL